MTIKIYPDKQRRISFILNEYITALVSPVDQSVGISSNIGRQTAVPRRYGGVPGDTCIQVI